MDTLIKGMNDRRGSGSIMSMNKEYYVGAPETDRHDSLMKVLKGLRRPTEKKSGGIRTTRLYLTAGG